MKKIFIVSLVMLSFLTQAKDNQTDTKHFQNNAVSRIHQVHHSKKLNESFGVIYVINHNTHAKKTASLEIIVSTDQGQLIIGENRSLIMGANNDPEFINKNLSDDALEALFFSDPIFDQFIEQYAVDLDSQLELLKNYSASECNNLESAINQVFAAYMHLRRTSNDDGAIHHAQMVLTGLVMEYNSNC